MRVTAILSIMLAVSSFVFAGCSSKSSNSAQAIAPAQASTKVLSVTQEVDASGQGTTENDAFKQAVVDAVRQVVGTLVTSENVVNNERVIQDKILTVSNGFVEKVLSQNKKKLADGTWVVNLKCVVRKGQLYGSLQKANVPTVKFDGVSLFADVVSQLDHEKSAVEMIRNAMKKFSINLVTATVLDKKPEIISRDENQTTIKFTWCATVDVDGFFENCAPALVEAFSAAASENLRPISISADIDAGKFRSHEDIMYNKALMPENPFTDFSNHSGFVWGGLVGIPISRGRSSWKANVNRIAPQVLQQLPSPEKTMCVIAYFKDVNGNILLETPLDFFKFETFTFGNRYREPIFDHANTVNNTVKLAFLPSIYSLMANNPSAYGYRQFFLLYTYDYYNELGKGIWQAPFGSGRGRSFKDELPSKSVSVKKNFTGGAEVLTCNCIIGIENDILPKIIKIELAVKPIIIDQDRQVVRVLAGTGKK